MTYAVIPVSGPIREEEGLPDLPILQATVGGYVEVLGLSDGTVMWINEHGKVSDPPLAVNPRASFLAAGRSVGAIVGDVVLTGPADDEGEVTSLSLDMRATLRSLVL